MLSFQTDDLETLREILGSRSAPHTWEGVGSFNFESISQRVKPYAAGEVLGVMSATSRHSVPDKRQKFTSGPMSGSPCPNGGKGSHEGPKIFLLKRTIQAAGAKCTAWANSFPQLGIRETKVRASRHQESREMFILPLLLPRKAAHADPSPEAPLLQHCIPPPVVLP